MHHKTLKKAIVALSLAGSLPVPSIDERVLQVAIGGDPDSMMIGNFLTCQGLRNKPNINVRCACGFVVGSSPTVSNNILRHLLRPRCGGIDQNSKCYLLYCFTFMFIYLLMHPCHPHFHFQIKNQKHFAHPHYHHCLAPPNPHEYYHPNHWHFLLHLASEESGLVVNRPIL